MVIVVFFLCYRGEGAEIAKNFKKALASIKNENFGYVWYSDQENIGNFVLDIPKLISSARYAILFLSQNFTKNFLKDGKNNYGNEYEVGCVTVREIVEIERHRQAGNLTIIGVHIDGYKLTPDDLSILKQVFINEKIYTPSSLAAYAELNINSYHTRTTDTNDFVSTVSRGMAINATGSSINYNKQIKEFVSWLISVPQHWGPNNRSSIPQNANTCEGLLAFKISGNDITKNVIYKKALLSIFNNITERGLQSKTLKTETVMCTSMALFLFGMERKYPTGTMIDYNKFDRIAENLWNSRNSEYGWGFFCEKTPNNSCNMVTTCWALLALNHYNFIAETSEYKDFCRQIFEFEADGTFGYYFGDVPKVIATSMYLCLLYSLESKFQEQMRGVYDYLTAIDFVYNGLVKNNTQVEIMADEDEDDLKVKRAPWNHITIGAALSALSFAYSHGDLDVSKWNGLLKYIDSLLHTQVYHVSQEKCCYCPPNMNLAKGKLFTFPTAYLIWGLKMIEKAIEKQLLRSVEQKISCPLK